MNSGAFWALVLGLMATIFGGMAFCYGLVILGEKVVKIFRVKHSEPSLPPLRRAA